MKTTNLPLKKNALLSSRVIVQFSKWSLGLLLTCFITTIYSQSTTPPRELLRFKIESKTNYDNAVLYLQENATVGFDSKYDAYKILNPKINLYTSPIDGLKLSINALANTDLNIKLPLCFSSREPGLHKIKIMQYSNPGLFAEISIIDVYNQTVTLLSLGQEFDFEISQADSGKIISDRYLISIKSNNLDRTSVVTSDRDVSIETVEDIDLFPNPVGSMDHLNIHMNHHSNNDVNIEIDNVAGKEVEHFQVPYSDNIDIKDVQDLKSGMYIIHINQDGQKELNKKFIKN